MLVRRLGVRAGTVPRSAEAAAQSLHAAEGQTVPGASAAECPWRSAYHHERDMNTAISPKVSAAAGAAGGSTPLSIVIIWLIGLLHVTIPPEVAAAIASLVAALASLIAGYVVPHSPQQPPA